MQQKALRHLGVKDTQGYTMTGQELELIALLKELSAICSELAVEIERNGMNSRNTVKTAKALRAIAISRTTHELITQQQWTKASTALIRAKAYISAEMFEKVII